MLYEDDDKDHHNIVAHDAHDEIVVFEILLHIDDVDEHFEHLLLVEIDFRDELVIVIVLCSIYDEVDDDDDSDDILIWQIVEMRGIDDETDEHDICLVYHEIGNGIDDDELDIQVYVMPLDVICLNDDADDDEMFQAMRLVIDDDDDELVVCNDERADTNE